MRTLKLLLLLLVFLVPFVAAAQGLAAWEVALYYESGQPGAKTGEIVVLTPNGTTATYTVPAGIYAAAAPDSRADVAVSPDRRYAAVAFWSGSGGQLPSVAILNLETGTCCTYAAPPVADMDGYALAGFSPDSTQLAISYIGFNDRNTYDTAGGLYVVDAATGATVASLTVEQASAALATPESTAFLQPGTWTAEGVRFLPSCYACEGVMQSPWYVWNPQTNTLLQTANAYFSIFGDTLDVTNELLLNAYNTAYPTGEALGMFPPANVIEYYSQGVPPAPEQAQALQASAPVVYFDPANLDLSQARWVLDGNAFLLQATANVPQSVVVYRSGQQESVGLGVNDRFLTGTPDGFLAQRLDGWISYYQYDGSAWNVIDLDMFVAEVQVIDSPALGGSVTQPFTVIQTGAQGGGGAIEQPVLAPQQQTPTSCPGLLEPRLAPGGLGLVSSGIPNRVRADSTLGAQILGLMENGQTFSVLSGPVCDAANGIVWWQVDFNGLVGWTAESQGESYFVQPLS